MSNEIEVIQQCQVGNITIIKQSCDRPDFVDTYVVYNEDHVIGMFWHEGTAIDFGAKHLVNTEALHRAKRKL